jgi:hypothetical protein
LFQPDWGDTRAERLRAEWPWSRFAPEPVEISTSPLLRDGEIPRAARAAQPARARRSSCHARSARATSRGVAPHEIHVVARALVRTPWLETIFDGHGIRHVVARASRHRAPAGPGST